MEITAADFLRHYRASDPQFRNATVLGDVDLKHHPWPHPATVDGVVFEGRFDAHDVTFARSVHLSGATFRGPIDFSGATVEGSATFDGAVFAGSVRFDGTSVLGDLSLRGCDLETALSLGAIKRCDQLVLDRATTGRYLAITVGADRVSCHRTRFNEGVHLKLTSAGRLTLDEAYFGRSSVISGDLDDQATIASMCSADVEHLSLGDISLCQCRFAGAHNLDGLRLEGGTPFVKAPRRTAGRRREVLAEEIEWRSARPKPKTWDKLVQPEPRSTTKGSLEPNQIAPLYRALRKGREDAKYAPGAGDFYYGEMEMRRASPSNGVGEKALLWCYWLLGYGVRPVRSSLVFLAVVAAFTAAILEGGPHERLSDGENWLPSECTAVTDVTSKLGCVTKPLTFALNPLSPQARGRDEPDLPNWIELAAVPYRLITIALFGLTFLGLRARVQR